MLGLEQHLPHAQKASNTFNLVYKAIISRSFINTSKLFFFDTFMTIQLKSSLISYIPYKIQRKKSGKLKCGFTKLLIYWICIMLLAGNNFPEWDTNNKKEWEATYKHDQKYYHPYNTCILQAIQ